MSERVDVVVIGAGVVGLAVARALAKAGRDVIVVERHDAFGTETSARNSEVIHAGIYYRPGGVRAQLAVKGRNMLYDFCRAHGVDHMRCGKLIVAFGDEERAGLAALKSRAERNGVDDLRILSGVEAKGLEPNLACDAAMLSPSTGIVDSHSLMLAMLGDLEDAGGALALSSPVLGGRVEEDGIDLEVGGAEPIALRARTVVNCAGLSSDKVARSILGVPGETIPPLKYGKGQYFTYSGAAPFSHLIYPMPSPDSQGVHYSYDLGGQAKLGPDLVFVDDPEDYRVDAARRDAFAVAARRYWPDLDPDHLQPGYAGIRPKTKGPGEEGDFIFSGPSVHGVPGYLGLYGIESPGLTTSLAIAEHVLRLINAG